MTNLEKLAESIVGFSSAQITTEVRELVQSHILDVLITVGGSRNIPGGDIALKVACEMGGEGASRMLFTRLSTTPATAAFANVQRSVALDLGSNLFFSQGLPGLCFLPTLALAEREGLSGTDVIVATICGFEAAARVELSMPPLYTPTADLDHVQGLAGPRSRWIAFGGAAAVAKLLNLDVHQTAQALALAASTAPMPPGPSLFRGDNDAMAKGGLTGAMGWTSITAGLLAAHGFTGDLGIVEAGGGFYRGMGTQLANPHVFDTSFGDPWLIARANFKRYPSGTHNQQALHTLARLLCENDIPPEDIEEIHVGRAIGLSKLFANRRPSNYVAGQFSLPYTAAMVALRTPPSQWASSLGSPEADRLADRVQLVESDEAVNQFVEIYDCDQARDPWELRSHVRVKAKRGEFESWSEYGYVSFDDLLKKAADHLGDICNEGEIASLAEGIRHLHQLSEVGEFTASCMA